MVVWKLIKAERLSSYGTHAVFLIQALNWKRIIVACIVTDNIFYSIIGALVFTTSSHNFSHFAQPLIELIVFVVTTLKDLTLNHRPKILSSSIKQLFIFFGYSINNVIIIFITFVETTITNIINGFKIFLKFLIGLFWWLDWA